MQGAKAAFRDRVNFVLIAKLCICGCDACREADGLLSLLAKEGFSAVIAVWDRIGLAVAVALGLAGCTPADLDSDNASSGGPRIVSLNPCLDAILVEVAEPAQILALSHYSADPQSSSISRDVARRYDFTGGTVEEVLALKPDLVLVSTFMAPATRAALDDLGVRVESFGSPGSVDESVMQVNRLATLVEQRRNGEMLVEKIERSVRQSNAVKPVSAVLWQPGGIVAGERQLISELLRAAGFSSHSAALGLGQADYLSLEQVLVDPPDVLLVAGKSPPQQHPALKEAEIKVAHFDPSLVYCGGPTIPRAMERLREIREVVS